MRYVFRQCFFDESDGRLGRVGSDQSISLRPQVARLLSVFLRHPGEVLGRERLCQAVWDDGTVIDFESGLAAILRELRRALVDLDLPADLIETIPRRGYRLNLDGGDIDAGQVGNGDAASRRMVLPGLLVVVVVALVVVAGLWWWQSQETGVPERSEYALAILPFEQFSGHDRPPEHASLLLADYLLAELWQRSLDNVSLIGRTSLRAYAGREDVAAAVAEDLGVNLLLEGSIMAESDGWRVDVRLLEMPLGRVIWSQMLLWPEHDALPVADSARQIVDDLHADWPELQ